MDFVIFYLGLIGLVVFGILVAPWLDLAITRYWNWCLGKQRRKD